MNLSIELTAYPLEDEYLPVVEKYIKHLRSYKNIKIEAFSKNWKPYALIGLCNIAIPFTLIA